MIHIESKLKGSCKTKSIIDYITKYKLKNYLIITHIITNDKYLRNFNVISVKSINNIRISSYDYIFLMSVS